MEGIKNKCKIELYKITESLAWNTCNNERGESPFSLCTCPQIWISRVHKSKESWPVRRDTSTLLLDMYYYVQQLMLASFLILVFKVLTKSLIIKQHHLYQHKPYTKFMFPLLQPSHHLYH